MRRIVSSFVLAAFAIAAASSLGGCAAVKNPFFAMSSDSPMPYFGGEITLPSKLSLKRQK